MRSNCLLWAVRQWWPTRKQRTYLCFTWSLWYPGPHVLFARKLPDDCEHFVPLNPKRRRFPPLWFRGYVKRGD